MISIENLTSEIEYAITLIKFRNFCDKNFDKDRLSRLRLIYSRSSNKIETINSLFTNEINESLNEHESSLIQPLFEAFLNKSTFRKPIPESIKTKLLLKQNNKCTICCKSIDLSAHADHIIPFKYVGDELPNNLQMLCSSCNTKKNASFDYQIRYYLKLL